ncbi:MAG: sensor domain-containing diguanylate cyclase [Spirochaetales bacterium]|nr:sensor domain-containing diguanylate cyclase [Spirochaetales bacterium]
MKIQENSYQDIIQNLNDGIYFTDTNRTITYWNKAAEKITGFKASEVIGRACSDNILNHVDKEGNQLCLGLCPLAASLCDEKPREADVYLHHRDGHRVHISVRTSTIKDDDGIIIGGSEIFTDISQQEATMHRIKELEKLALIDPLTNVPNRKYIENEIEKRMKEFQRIKIPFGVIFIDIDNFKNFNDTYGHEVGDDILKFVAQTLSMAARPFDVFGRWGGEEFLGVIPNINKEDLNYLGDRLRVLVENSFILKEDEKLSVTISMGGTIATTKDSIKSLVKRADDLMYKSKESGKNRMTVN